MSTELSIGELARAVEVPTSTVRYYERVGLLSPAGRTAGNYRFYDREALERLRFIRAAQGAGFTLEDVSTLLDLRDGTLAPCAEVQTLIEHRLEGVAAKMADFRRVQKELKASLALCRDAAGSDHCGVLDRLAEAAAGPSIERGPKT